jgi:hypothetical protein
VVKTQIQEGKENNSAKTATRIVIPRWGTVTLHVKEGETKSKAGVRLRVGEGREGMNRIMVQF